MQEKIEKLKICSLKCSLTKMKMSGIKEKVTMVKKAAGSSLHQMLVGMLKPGTPNLSIQVKLIHIQEDKMSSHLVF